MHKKVISFLIVMLLTITSTAIASMVDKTSLHKENIVKIDDDKLMINNGNGSYTSFEKKISFVNPEEYKSNRILPDAFDWRNVNGVDWTTPIRDQIQDKCGSCWAFGALGALESNYKIWMNLSDETVDFSEQYILSCSPGSCDGWYLSSTLGWIRHHGIISENCMPYEANDTVPCESKCETWRDELVGIIDYTKISRGDISAIQDALLTYGPLPATMNVYGDFYPEWNGGVYQQQSDEYVFGHVITIVGFDNNWGDEDEGYWICKNSWGSSWGEDGWFRIAYGECNIENFVYYITGPNYAPNKPDQPTGPSIGKPNVTYSFASNCIDPDGHMLYYMFDWGDGNDSGWLGPFLSGETISANYTWPLKGSYSVRVKTMDLIGSNIYDYGIESEWSDPLEVAMPKGNKIVFLELFFNDLIESFSVFRQLPAFG